MAKKPTKAAKRAALDRILAAVRKEQAMVPGLPVEDVIGWLSYAILRDTACLMATDQAGEEPEQPDWSPKDEAESSFDLHCDERPDFEDTLDGLAAKIGHELDPDYGKPIDPKTHKSWL